MEQRYFDPDMTGKIDGFSHFDSAKDKRRGYKTFSNSSTTLLDL